VFGVDSTESEYAVFGIFRRIMYYASNYKLNIQYFILLSNAAKIMKNTILYLFLLLLLVVFASCKNSEKTKIEPVGTQGVIIPFELTKYNNIKIKTVLNGTDSLDLKFDSGTTGLLLTHQAIKEKTNLLSNGKESTPTQNYVKLDSLATLQIGRLTFDDLEIYPVLHSGQETDGRFGWDLFADRIVILDYDKMQMIIQDGLPDVSAFTKSKLNKVKTVLCLDGKISIKNKDYKSRFLFDTGYQKALLLDSIIMKEQSFPKDLRLIKKNQLRNGAGEIFITEVVELPQLTIGNQVITKVPTQLLNKANPAGFKTHILGNELLKRFNTILDLKQGYIYFQKNGLFDQKYSDAS